MLLLKILAIYFAAASLITLILYGVDKYKAVHGLWRISERTLLLSSFLGGAVGGSMGMLLFRHKTRHWYFVAVNFIGVIWQMGLLIFLVIRQLS